MQLFLHTPERIRIINEALTPSEFECSPAQWAAMQPGYPELPDGKTGRYWTPEQNYTMDGVNTYPEEFDGAPYCQALASYVTPCIFADIQLNKTSVCQTVPTDAIQVEAWLKDAAGNVLDFITQTWIIRLRDAAGEEADAFAVAFVEGHAAPFSYTCPPDASLGRLHVDENDFEEVAGYAVKLSQSVEITIYRTL